MRSTKKVKGVNDAASTDNSAVPADVITLLVCSPDHSASKTFTRNADGGVETQAFNAGTRFAVKERPVSGIHELSAILSALESLPNVLVIRGVLRNPPAPARGIRRLNKNFASPARGHYWLLIDFDKIELPDGFDLRRDPRAVIEHLVSLLPSEFHSASYHYQLSSSAGMGDPRRVSAHVWFWGSESWPDSELKTWGNAVNNRAGRKLVDVALFQDVQAHYTAAPIFEGVENPFPVRSGLVEKDHDAVSIQEIAHAPKHQNRSVGSFEPGPGFESLLANIGDHPGGGGFHEPIIRAIASYVSAHGRECTDIEALFAKVHDAVLSADRSQHDDDYVERMASREHIMPAINGALEKFGERPASQRRSKLVADVAPLPRGETLDSQSAHQRLSSLLDKIIGGSAP